MERPHEHNYPVHFATKPIQHDRDLMLMDTESEPLRERRVEEEPDRVAITTIYVASNVTECVCLSDVSRLPGEANVRSLRGGPKGSRHCKKMERSLKDRREGHEFTGFSD